MSEAQNPPPAVQMAGWIGALADRTPAPGGGAAAAVAGALAAASGAMAAAYTTGKKWPDRSAEADALATRLRDAAHRALELADEDAAAYARVRTAQVAGAPAVAEAEVLALGVPQALLALLANEAEAVAAFLPRCNPQLVSDILVSLHLFAGAAKAAWRTLLANRPPASLADSARVVMMRVIRAESQAEVLAGCD